MRRWQLLSATLVAALVVMSAVLAAAIRPEATNGVIRAGVGLDEFSIGLPDHPLAAGVPLHLDVTNVGAVPHDFYIDDVAATPVLDAGETARLELGGLLPGVYRVHCDVPGHVEAGMVGQLWIADERARDHEHEGDSGH